jgi:hypothetical protein
MKVRKSLTAFGAALMMIGVSAPAAAAGFDWDSGVCGDRDATAQELVRLSEHLRCGEEAPSWPQDNPIWQKMGSGSCDVHESLADKLWVAPSDTDGSPGKGKGKGKGPNNTAEGAAQKVSEAKDDEAITKLMQLLDAINKSKPSRDFIDGVEAAAAISGALEVIIEYEAIPCVKALQN